MYVCVCTETQVRKASADEIANVDGQDHPALAEGSKLKDVLSALSGMVSGGDETSLLASMEAEGKELMGEIAEGRVQLIEVKSTNYVAARVEEETADASQERKQEEEAEAAARNEALALKDQSALVEAKREGLHHSTAPTIHVSLSRPDCACSAPRSPSPF